MLNLLLPVLWGLGSLCACLTAGDEILDNGSFESGSDGWVPIGPVTLTPGNEITHSGCCSLLVANRTDTWNGVGQVVTDRLVPGRSYAVSAWVRLAAGDPQTVDVKYRKIDGDGTKWILLAQGEARADAWREFIGAFTHEPVGTVESLRFFVAGPEPGTDFHVDSLSIRELDADWREDADARIQALRTRPVSLQVVDPEGCPVDSVDIEVAQDRRAFAFGTAINRNHMDNSTYTDFVADNFEWAVMENAAKWRQNQNNAGLPDYSDADGMVEFCLENDLRMRGHCVFWASPIRVPDWVQPLEGRQLEDAISQRIQSVIPRYAEVFEHWDVNNEMITNRFFADRLGDEIRTSMFQQVRALDQDVTLMVNDFSILNNNRQTAILQQVETLEAAGADVDAIGAQGHFQSPPQGEVVLERLDNLARSGKPIWITEFDCPEADEQVRADALETVYRTAFSHASVEGILMWGFWAGSLNSGPDAALVNIDWTLTESGRRYQALMTEWTTQSSGSSDRDGRHQFNGFHGDYTVTLTRDGITSAFSVEVPVGTDLLEITLETAFNAGCSSCAADLNDDQVVDGVDISKLLGGWGQSGPTDLDQSGTTDGADLAVLLSGWGACF